MPRKAASSYVPVHMRPKFTGKRIEAPDELDAEQRAIFDGVVKSLPANWFHECNKQLLVEYAVAVAARRQALRIWNKVRLSADIEYVRQVSREMVDLSKLILALSRAMRLAQLSVKRQTITEHKDVAAPSRVWDAA